MSAPACPHFERCSAPICPEDAASLASCAWFPDEGICKRADHADLPWVMRQRLIARRTGGDFERGCFNTKMLQRNCRVTHAIKGLDPEKGEITAERVHLWLKEHPPISEAELARMRAQAEKARANSKGFGAAKGHSLSVPETPADEGVSEVGETVGG